MKKKLLCCFTLLSMVAGQAMSQSQLCRPELTWGAYACISKVEITWQLKVMKNRSNYLQLLKDGMERSVLIRMMKVFFLLITRWTKSVLLRWRQVKSMN